MVVGGSSLVSNQIFIIILLATGLEVADGMGQILPASAATVVPAAATDVIFRVFLIILYLDHQSPNEFHN